MAAATSKNHPRYWNRMGKGNEYNYLFVLTPYHSLLIGWMDMLTGPRIYSVTWLIGQPEHFNEQYHSLPDDMAAAILTAAITGLEKSMPYKCFS